MKLTKKETEIVSKLQDWFGKGSLIIIERGTRINGADISKSVEVDVTTDPDTLREITFWTGGETLQEACDILIRSKEKINRKQKKVLTHRNI